MRGTTRNPIAVLALTGLVFSWGMRPAEAAKETINVSVASYNVHGITIADGKCPRTRKFRFVRIAEVANRYDVVLLQEFFYSRASKDEHRLHLLDASKHEIQYQHLHAEDLEVRYDSGLGALARAKVPASNWSVTEYKGITVGNETYPRCHGKTPFGGSDCDSTKGFARFEIARLAGKVAVYTTHLDSAGSAADRKVRVGQMIELRRAMEKDKEYGNGIILAGDFNTIKNQNDPDSKALAKLEAELGLTPRGAC